MESLPLSSSLAPPPLASPSLSVPSPPAPPLPSAPPQPPAPPLPPALPVQSKICGLQKSNLQSGGKCLGQMFTSMASESKKACSQFLSMRGLPEDVTGDFIFLSSYTPVQPVIQNGPICGMVALAMASQLAGRADVTTEELFTEAWKRGFSKQGEMFSVASLEELASHFLSCHVERIDLRHDAATGRLDGQEIIEHLLARNLVLIPYDADKNHGPCQKRGHKAHWALLTGFFMAFNTSKVPDLDLSLMQWEKDADLPSLCYWPSSPSQSACEQVANLVKQKCVDFYVFGHHGKSKYAGLWALTELLQSNDNLLEAGPERNCEDYVLPPGGVEAGLRSKIVIIHRTVELPR